MLRKTITLLTYLFLCVPAFAFNLSIPKPLESGLSISIYDTSTNHYIYQYQSSFPRMIASNMKILTSYMALDTLGSGYTFDTILVANSLATDQGILHGDIGLIGGGDPSLTSGDLSAMFNMLHSKNVRTIDGDVIIDNTIFSGKVSSTERNPNYFAEYSVNPDGLIVDGNMSSITFNKNGKKLQTTIYPFDKSAVLHVRLTKNKYADCQYHGGDNLKLRYTSSGNLDISGSMPEVCLGYSYYFNLLQPASYDLIMVQDALAQNNIQLTGKVRFAHISENDFYPIKIVHQSLPLSQLLITMNFYSNNLYAKTLFMTTALHYTMQNSIDYTQAVMYFMQDVNRHFQTKSMVAQNGSGLSRSEVLTTDEMATILLQIYHSPYYHTILDSLPSPGYYGTLYKSFPQFKDKLRVKTGTLGDAKNYSGYYMNNGKVYIVTFMLNTSLYAPGVTSLYNTLVENALLQLN